MSGDHLFWLVVAVVKDIFSLDVIIIGRGQTKKSGLCFSFEFGDEKIEFRIATITLRIYTSQKLDQSRMSHLKMGKSSFGNTLAEGPGVAIVAGPIGAVAKARVAFAASSASCSVLS